jgi:hypothetical protein
VQASPGSGRFLVFKSEARPQGTGDHSTAGQLFRYDAQNGELVRVSIGNPGTYICPQSGEAEVGYNCNGNVTSDEWAPGIEAPEYFTFDRAMAASAGVDVTSAGAVVFQSRSALTPQAANGHPFGPGLVNVYEYVGGRVYLISSGDESPTGEAEAGPISRTRLSGFVAEGKGVLFRTAAPLLPGSPPTFASLYDANVDGGFPPSSQSPGCEGGGCRGAVSAPSAGPGAASQTIGGGGNVHAKRRCGKGRTLKARRCVKTRHRRRHEGHHHARRHSRQQAKPTRKSPAGRPQHLRAPRDDRRDGRTPR